MAGTLEVMCRGDVEVEYSFANAICCQGIAPWLDARFAYRPDREEIIVMR